MQTFQSFVGEEVRFLAENANKAFQDIVDKVLTDEERKVKKPGGYKLQKKTHKIQIDRKDFPTYEKLYFETYGKGTGNGEIALWWLFNYDNKGVNQNRTKVTQGGSDPDLNIDRMNAEVKAYSHNPKGKISLGRYERRRTFRALLNTMFGIHNLRMAFEGDLSRAGGQQFKGEITFRLKDIMEAAESFTELKDLLNSQKQLQNFKIFVDMKKTIDKFDKEVSTIGHKGDKPEDYAYSLLKSLIMDTLGEKPGDKGYIINCPDGKRKAEDTIYIYYIDFKNMSKDLKALDTVEAGGAGVKAGFNMLFPGSI
jgi:hypothetical protein